MSKVKLQKRDGYGNTGKPPLLSRRSAKEKENLALSKVKDDAPSRHHSELPRSASYTYIGNAKNNLTSFNTSPIKESFSEVDLHGQHHDVIDIITPPDTSGVNTPEEGLPEADRAAAQARAQALIAELQKDANIKVTAPQDSSRDGGNVSAPSTRQHSDSTASNHTVSTVASTVPTTPRQRSSIASNFSRKINRRSWVGSTPTTPSRSPSPAKKEESSTNLEGMQDGGDPLPIMGSVKRRLSLSRRKSAKDMEKESIPPSRDESTDAIKRKSTVLRRKPGRTLSGIFKNPSTDENAPPSTGGPEGRSRSLPPSEQSSLSSPATGNKGSSTYDPARPAVPPLPKSFSTDKLPSLRSEQLSQDRAAPMPRLLSSDRVPTSGSVLPRKKDELWNVFRALDGDYTKFSSKTLAFKASVVRSSLLPFLRHYASHPSNKTLRPEDLDRRTNILNKWWTGLVELLHGRNNQSISGTDRPTILDGIAGIMERPEWRLAPSPFCPLRERIRATSTPRNRSKASVTSDSSDFLADTVHHNVRNIFIQNLSEQMAFVVDKMSLRNASASLVTFCGKACAYAFMFVPGMADVLVRVWDLQMDQIRRVLEGNGIGKFDNLTDVAGGVVPAFPPALHQLGFSSLMKYMRKLRTPPPLPIGTHNVQWWGSWLDRWSGRESDLFYVFVKYFHILTTDFMTTDASKKERMCAPGMLLVHAQMLMNLDAIIHRNATQAHEDPAAAVPSPTFDDVLADPDAVAPALPIPPTNAVRTMAENRLIMLIRDFLSERAGEHPIARRMFAQSFNDLLQTAARGTSMFDHAACYTLLDFLEEALPLLVRFEDLEGTKGSLMNVEFWSAAWRKMIESQNTMTEIRLYAFLYTVWNTVICDLGWKAELCKDLLLDSDIFESRFNHWCPMVRAYYMRLLCWRVGRYDGEAPPGDVSILETMAERVQTIWSYYLHLRERAVREDTLAPPTNPCNPAPNRRLLIIRTDPQLSPSTTFVSFDGLVGPRTPTDATSRGMKRNSTISHVIEIDARPESVMSFASDFSTESRGRGFGGFFRNLMSSSKNRSKSQGSPTPPKPQQNSPPTPNGQPGLMRAATDDFQQQKPQQSSPAIEKQPPPTQHVRNFSFKFSLEYHPNTKPLPPMRLLPPRLPLPAQQLLQTSDPFSQKLRSAPRPLEPTGESIARARYCGRALAEWAMVLGECQSFFDRRKHEGVPANRFVETPMLGIEVFRRPG